MGGTMSQLMRWQNEEGTTLEDRQSWRNASLSIQYISEYRIPQQKRTIKSKQLPKKKKPICVLSNYWFGWWNEEDGSARKAFCLVFYLAMLRAGHALHDVLYILIKQRGTGKARLSKTVKARLEGLDQSRSEMDQTFSHSQKRTSLTTDQNCK